MFEIKNEFMKLFINQLKLQIIGYMNTLSNIKFKY